jgi:hypothetical protein
MAKVLIAAQAFKDAIKEITRFKQSSALAGSELIYMRADVAPEGATRLRMYGGVSVVARTSCGATGSLPCVAVDSRTLQPYAERISEPVKILISAKDKLILFRSGVHDLDVSLLEGPEEWPKVGKGELLGTMDEPDAAALRYLAALVPDVQTRPDLAAIAVVDGKGIASSQKCAAVVVLTNFSGNGFIPATLARDLVTGDRVFKSGEEIVLRSGQASYSMALPAEITSFPLSGVMQMMTAKKTKTAICDGSKFAEAMIACRDCLGFVSKLGAFVELTPLDGKLQLLAQSGSTTYKTRIEAEVQGKETKLYAPVEDAVNFSPLCTDSQLTFSRGTQNGEMFIKSDKLDIVVASGRVEE